MFSKRPTPTRVLQKISQGIFPGVFLVLRSRGVHENNMSWISLRSTDLPDVQAIFLFIYVFMLQWNLWRAEEMHLVNKRKLAASRDAAAVPPHEAICHDRQGYIGLCVFLLCALLLCIWKTGRMIKSQEQEFGWKHKFLCVHMDTHAPALSQFHGFWSFSLSPSIPQ